MGRGRGQKFLLVGVVGEVSEGRTSVPFWKELEELKKIMGRYWR